MTLQNRVMPDGQIVAHPARGAFTGNRGILHRADRTLGVARWQHKAWVCCLLQFKDHHRVPMTGRTWTELFFHDEAVALAAGHRPCGYCRRADHLAFRAAWEAAHGPVRNTPAIDTVLQAARVNPRTRAQITHTGRAASLPDGVFFQIGGRPHLCHDGAALPFAPGGYAKAVALPAADVVVLTPAPIVAVLRAGYRPHIKTAT